jgi:hypothetical protein
MKITDFEEVESYMQTLKKLDAALESVDYNIKYIGEGVEKQGSILGSCRGYSGSVSLQSKVDLVGCYLGVEVAQALRSVILDKRQKILDRLTELGVE